MLEMWARWGQGGQAGAKRPLCWEGLARALQWGWSLGCQCLSQFPQSLGGSSKGSKSRIKGS